MKTITAPFAGAFLCLLSGCATTQTAPQEIRDIHAEAFSAAIADGHAHCVEMTDFVRAIAKRKGLHASWVGTAHGAENHAAAIVVDRSGSPWVLDNGAKAKRPQLLHEYMAGKTQIDGGELFLFLTPKQRAALERYFAQFDGDT